MENTAQFTIAWNIKSTNEERIAAFNLYQRAFHAQKLSESTPPGGEDLHILMEMGGIVILLGPGSAEGNGLENPLICEMRFRSLDEFRHAYGVLAQEAKSAVLEGPYPWATQLGLITDKFGIGWALYYNQ